MTLAHWLYVLGVVVVVVTMILRRNVVIPCVIFTFLIGWVYLGNFIGGIQALFNSNIIAAQELFSVFYIIAVMVAMLKSVSVTGADKILVTPLTKLMVSPVVSYVVLCIATIIISLFFWPTPAVPLIGTLLVPAAVSAGLPPMMGAMALALAGQGFALGGDIIIQGAPKLTAGAANIPVEMVTYRGGILTLITGIIAITLAYFMNRKEIAEFKPIDKGAHMLEEIIPVDQSDEKLEKPQYAKFLAYLMVISMVFVIISMFAFKLRGGDASALLGGVGLLIMMIASLTVYGDKGLDAMADFLADGLVFAFKVMGPIIPIAGFFFLGNPEAVVNILDANAPGFLFDIGKTLSQLIPPTGILAGLGMMILGVITGLDGSGFSGLPLVGTLAGAMAAGQQSVAAGLGAIGQIGAIWSGGGTIVAWCSLVAVAGIVGVPVLDLVRKNFIPVVVGLIVSTIFGVLFLM